MSKIPSDPGTQAASATTQTPQSTHTGSPQTSSNIQIASTSILPQLAKDLSIGEIINFTVRGKTPEGLGMLYFLGQLIQAKIPDHLKVGDRVQAQIGYENEQILFKILSVLGKENETGSNFKVSQQNFGTLTQHLSKTVEEILFTLSKFLPGTQGTLPANLPNNTAPIPSYLTPLDPPLTELRDTLAKLFSLLPSQEDITQSSTFLPKLQDLLKLSTTNAMKEISKELSIFLKNHTIPQEQKFILTLLEQLQTLGSKLESISVSQTGISQEGVSRESFRNSLDIIIRALEQEITKGIKEGSKENIKDVTKETFQTTLKVVTALLKEAYMSSEPSAASIRKIIDYIQANTIQAGTTPLDAETAISPRILGEVRTLVTTLEQFSYTQELFLRLEPILQSMKQPELLLFPFLFQGVFSFGELLIDPDRRRSPGDKKQKNEEDTEKEKTEVPIMQYQAMLPLPHLGIVRFNTVQSNEEITLKLSFEDVEKAAFVEEQIRDLRNELSKLGFNKLDISARGDEELLL